MCQDSTAPGSDAIIEGAITRIIGGSMQMVSTWGKTITMQSMKTIDHVAGNRCKTRSA